MNKLRNLKDLKIIVDKLKKNNKKIVMTNGCFDIIHAGHVDYLQKSKKMGNKLIVAINSDVSIKLLKGNKRPINKLNDRIKVLSEFSSVDFIIYFMSRTPEHIYRVIKPDILTKGNEFKDINKIAGANYIIKNGGKVRLIKYIKQHSTTKIIKKLN
jgi:rfaE bifunctional protein nucleotidyltransferase chain/domain